MRKIFMTFLLSALTLSNVFACWFDQPDVFNPDNDKASLNVYLAGVNFFADHYNKNNNTFINGQSAALPLTVWLKVSPRTYKVNGVTQTYDIRIAKLYYKILPGGIETSSCKWRLAKSINMGNNPNWRMNFDAPVKLFGNDTITLNLITSKGDTISAGDHILIAFYISDNSPDCVSNAEDITEGSHNPVIGVSDSEPYNKAYNNEFRPAYIMRIIYTGRKLPKR